MEGQIHGMLTASDLGSQFSALRPSGCWMSAKSGMARVVDASKATIVMKSFIVAAVLFCKVFAETKLSGVEDSSVLIVHSSKE